MTRTALLTLALASGCAARIPPAAPEAVREPQPVPHAEPPPFMPAGPRLANCMINAGSVRVQRMNGVQTSSCSVNAECTAARGQMHGPTDGLIAMSCENAACVCRLQNAGPDAELFETPFEAPEPCTAETQRKFFREYCMAGSTFYEDR